MVVTGWEVDVFRKLSNGSTEPGIMLITLIVKGNTSCVLYFTPQFLATTVTIITTVFWKSQLYNLLCIHTLVAHISGKAADIHVEIPSPLSDTSDLTHGGPHYKFIDNGKGSGLAPISQAFSEHNGNEMRQTYV